MGTITRQVLNVIDGRLCEAESGDIDEVFGPASGAIIAHVPRGDAGDIDRAVQAAQAARSAWGRMTPGDRSRALHALAGVVEDHVEEFADVEALDAGKPRAAAAREVESAADVIRFYAGAARTLEGRAAGEYAAGLTSYIRREPLGVVGQITPWNYPLSMAVWKLAPALATGNTVVLKPSELAPLSALRLGELAQECLAPGVLNVVSGRGEDAGAALACHPGVALVAVTGSLDTGRAVIRASADRIGATHLELGGKAPFVVFDDADIDAAVSGLRTAAFYNAGQDCTAATRVLATPAAHDELLGRLPESVAALVVGDPLEPGTEMGPLISADHRDRVLGFVDRAVGMGATVIAGGHVIDGPGWYVAPTVLTNVRQDSEIVQQEVFGPVVTLQRVADEREALDWANDVRYGLAASVWTTNHGRATRAVQAISAGCVWINTHLPVVAEMPHGGFGASGHGKDLSLYSLEEYTRIKHVMSSIG